MQLLITQSSPASHHLLPPWSKHSPRHPILKHHQSVHVVIFLTVETSQTLSPTLSVPLNVRDQASYSYVIVSKMTLE